MNVCHSPYLVFILLDKKLKMKKIIKQILGIVRFIFLCFSAAKITVFVKIFCCYKV